MNSSESKSGAAVVPYVKHPLLGWGAVVVATLLFSMVMRFQSVYNLWLLSGITAAITLVLCYVIHRKPFFEMLAVSRRRIGLGLVGGLLLVGLTYSLYPVLIWLWPALTPQVKQLYAGLSAPPGLVVALPVVCLLILAEECIWRGLLVDLLRPSFGGWRLILLCSLLFPIPHLVSGKLMLALAAFLMGVVCTMQRLIHRNLLTPLVTHLVWDVVVIVFFPLVVVF